MKKRGRDDFEEDDNVRSAAQELGSVLDRGIDVKLLALDRISQLIDPRDEIYANNVALIHADAAFYITELLSDTTSDAVAIRAANLIATLADHSIPAKSKLHTLGIDPNISKVLLNHTVQDAFIDSGAIEKLVPWLYTSSNIQLKIQAAQDALSTLTSFNMDAKVVYLRELVQHFVQSSEKKALQHLDILLSNMDCKSNEEVIDILYQLRQPLLTFLQSLQGEEYTQQALALLATLCERARHDVVDIFRDTHDTVLVIVQQLLLGSIQTQDIAVHALYHVTLGNINKYLVLMDKSNNSDNGIHANTTSSSELMMAMSDKLRALIKLSDELDKQHEEQENDTTTHNYNNDDNNDDDDLYPYSASIINRQQQQGDDDDDDDIGVIEICYVDEAELLLKAMNSILKKTSSYKSDGGECSGDDEEDSLNASSKRTSCCVM